MEKTKNLRGGVVPRGSVYIYKKKRNIYIKIKIAKT
jgi:hypothetical protein